ncbi:MAG TPA: hypothetical protein DDZ53_05775, partial [Firmicutes bacterium]|nr:hypothetical protein [Bacillota bacterium]
IIDPSSDSPQTNSDKVVQVRPTDMSIKDYSTYLIKDTIGEQSNTKKPSLQEIVPTENNTLVLDLNASENFTKSTTRQSMLIKAPKIFGKAFADRPELTSITISWYLDLVDVRGNEKVGKVMTITFTRENADTVNWENIDPENIPLVADAYWQHSLFTRE